MKNFTKTLWVLLLCTTPFIISAQTLEKREGAPVQGTYDLESYGSYVFLTGFNYSDYSKAGLYRSADEGETWTLMQQDDTPWDIKIDTFEDQLFFVTQMSGIYISKDSGDNWTVLPTPGTYVKDFEIARNGDWILAESNKLYKSDDEGDNWTELNSMFPPIGQNIQNVEVYRAPDPADDRFICLTLNGVYTSPDGVNWVPATGMPSVGTKSYDDIYMMYAYHYFLGAALTGHGDAAVIITQDGEVYMSPDGENFTLENTIPGIDNQNSVYLIKTGALPGGRLFGVVEDYNNSANSRLYQWNYGDGGGWTTNSGNNWFGEGATGGVNRFHGAIRGSFSFKTGADTTVGLIMAGEYIDGTDTFRIFKTNITAGAVGIVEAVNELAGISMYPNPLSNELGITLHNMGMPIAADITMVNLAGKAIGNWEHVLEEGSNALELPTEVGFGYYLLQVRDTKNGQTSTYKLLITKN